MFINNCGKHIKTVSLNTEKQYPADDVSPRMRRVKRRG
jgi:hypothetical protein